MTVQYYVQYRDLEYLSSNWKTHTKFSTFISHFPENEHYKSDNLAADFFDRVNDRYSKHFDQWHHKYLHLALGGDSIPSTYISRWILGLDLPTGQYVSTNHKTIIDVAAMGTFLTSGTTPIQIQGKAFFQLHCDAINQISEGVKSWDGEGSESVQTFRIYINAYWHIIPTNTQLVEQWVKDSNECTHSGKEDYVASLIAQLALLHSDAELGKKITQ